MKMEPGIMSFKSHGYMLQFSRFLYPDRIMTGNEWKKVDRVDHPLR
jgi:hypothetical protein